MFPVSTTNHSARRHILKILNGVADDLEKLKREGKLNRQQQRNMNNFIKKLEEFEDGKITVGQIYACLFEMGFGCMVEEGPGF